MNGNGRKQQQLAHRAGAVGREGLVKTVSSSPIPPLRSEYVHTSTEWQKPDRHSRFQVRAQLRSVTKITTFEITLLMSEQKPYPVWFLCRRNRQEL